MTLKIFETSNSNLTFKVTVVGDPKQYYRAHQDLREHWGGQDMLHRTLQQYTGHQSRQLTSHGRVPAPPSNLGRGRSRLDERVNLFEMFSRRGAYPSSAGLLARHLGQSKNRVGIRIAPPLRAWGGVKLVKEATGAQVAVGAGDAEAVDADIGGGSKVVDNPLDGDEVFDLGGRHLRWVATPGHTLSTF